MVDLLVEWVGVLIDILVDLLVELLVDLLVDVLIELIDILVDVVIELVDILILSDVRTPSLSLVPDRMDFRSGLTVSDG